MPRRKAGPGDGQEKFLLEFTPNIPVNEADFPWRAAEAAQRRKKRVGQYALGALTKGFQTRVNGLWIPASRSENSAVTSLPQVKVKKEKYYARQRIMAKFATQGISPQLIESWTQYSLSLSEERLFGKYSNYQLDARKQRVFLSTALMQPELSYSREGIMGSQLAYNALLWYLITLKAFASNQPDGSSKDKRRWILPAWQHVVAQEQAEASGFLDGQTDESFYHFYDEAYFNSWSREKYWAAVQAEHQQYLQAIKSQEPPVLIVPLDVYEQDGDTSYDND